MHPFADLSAYLDGALDQSARAVVETHLGGCALCRTRLAELRGTALLIAGLPQPVPTRSLVPRVSVPYWLAPVRTLATLASGAALFLFIASAVVAYFPFGVTGAGGAPAAAPAGAPAPNATTPSLTDRGRVDDSTALRGGASPSPGAAFSVQSPPTPTPAPAAQRSTQGAGDTAKEQSPSAAPSGQREETAATDQTQRVALGFDERRTLGPSPWMWLALAVGFGALALVVHRRLRAP